jgi:hypothetical protein
VDSEQWKVTEPRRRASQKGAKIFEQKHAKIVKAEAAKTPLPQELLIDVPNSPHFRRRRNNVHLPLRPLRPSVQYSALFPGLHSLV